MIYLIAAISAGVAGSFVNVLIWRLPRGEPPWKPVYSYCPHCRTTITAYDNIPIISWLWLRGRCRHCREPISWRYPAVELTIVILGLATAAALQYRQLFSWPAYAALLWFESILTAIAIIDFKTFLIPDMLSIGLNACMLLLAPWNPLLGDSFSARAWQAGLGAALGALIYFLLAIIGSKIYKTEAMGGGDVKLAGAIGAGLGAQHLFAIIVLSSTLGLLYAAPLVITGKLGRRSVIPYGPFMASAAILLVFLSVFSWSHFLSFPLERNY